MILKTVASSLFIALITSIAVISYDLNKKDYFRSITFLHKNKYLIASIHDRLTAINFDNMSGNFSDSELNFLRQNQDIGFSTLLLSNYFKEHNYVKNEDGVYFLNTSNIQVLKSIYDEGLSQTLLDERIFLLKILLTQNKITPMYSPIEIARFKAELRSLENNPTTLTFHANTINRITNDYPYPISEWFLSANNLLL